MLTAKQFTLTILLSVGLLMAAYTWLGLWRV